MSAPEHLDPEPTAPDLPDGYDPDGGWEPVEWWMLWGDPWLDELRDADFDDEETRP